MYLFLAFFFEIFGYARQYEQALLHSLARKLRSPCTIFANERQMALDKNHEKPLASFEAQGHAAGLNVELESLAAFARP